MVGGVQRDSDCERRLSSRRGPSDLYMHAASLWLAQGSASADLRAATVIAPRSQRFVHACCVALARPGQCQRGPASGDCHRAAVPAIGRTFWPPAEHAYHFTKMERPFRCSSRLRLYKGFHRVKVHVPSCNRSNPQVVNPFWLASSARLRGRS